MELVIYEDFLYANFLPLTYLRPVFDLRCGILSFRERIQRLYPGVPLHPFLREQLTGIERETSLLNDPQSLKRGGLFLNGRALLLHGPVPLEGDDEVFIWGDELIGFRLRKTMGDFELQPPFGRALLNRLRDKLPAKEVESPVLKYPWELVGRNSSIITRDFELLGGGEIEGNIDERAVVYGDQKMLHVGKGSRVDAFVVLNLENGPIHIGEDVLIRPPSTVDGPCFIGDGTLLEGARLRGSCSIGKACKVSGEVESSVFHGFSNKHHLGFLGHSYVGEWVNLGAGTTNSDLKNNYSPVRVQLGGEQIDTQSLWVGCFIGDHTKTGIGTLIDTGAVIGVFCNLFGANAVTPKFIPSFSWGNGKPFQEHSLDKAIETAKLVMGRRGVELTDNYKRLIEQVYQLTSEERRWQS